MKIHQNNGFSRITGLIEEFNNAELDVTKNYATKLYKYIKFFLWTFALSFLCALLFFDDLFIMIQLCVIVLEVIVLATLFLFYEYPKEKIPVTLAIFFASVIYLDEITKDTIFSKRKIQNEIRVRSDILDEMSSYGDWKMDEFEARQILKKKICM